MHRDFLTAIWHNEPISAVYDRLSEIQRKQQEKERHRLCRDYDIAQKVLAALFEPIDSAPYQWAQAFRKEAETQELTKSEEEKQREAERRQLEAEYLKLKKQEVDEMRHRHSER